MACKEVRWAKDLLALQQLQTLKQDDYSSQLSCCRNYGGDCRVSDDAAKDRGEGRGRKGACGRQEKHTGSRVVAEQLHALAHAL